MVKRKAEHHYNPKIKFKYNSGIPFSSFGKLEAHEPPMFATQADFERVYDVLKVQIS